MSEKKIAKKIEATKPKKLVSKEKDPKEEKALAVPNHVKIPTAEKWNRDQAKKKK
jgi:hypothetical protein